MAAHVSRGRLYMANDMDTQPSLELLRFIVENEHDPMFNLVQYPPNLYRSQFIRPAPSQFVMPLTLYIELGGTDEDFARARFHDDTLFAWCWAKVFALGGLRSRYMGDYILPPIVVHDSHTLYSEHPEEWKQPNLALQWEKVSARLQCNRGPVLRAPWRIVYQQG